jgi:septum formation protein
MTPLDPVLAPGSSPKAAAERTLILASASPRRRQLLAGLGFDLVVHPAEIAEVRGPDEDPADYTRRLSQEKAAAVRAALSTDETGPVPWIVAADTIVVLEEEVLEKPRDRADAVAMLTRLSDAWHVVITSFTVCPASAPDPDGPPDTLTRTVRTDVRFRDLPAASIEAYVATGDPMDKAGAYGIQEVGAFLVRELRGSYFAVMGLPVCEVVEALQELGAVSTFPFL